MFLWKNHPKTTKNRPKSHPTIFLLDLLYKTVLWCFLFDFMLISNGTGHSFIVFLHKKGDKIFWIFPRHVKNLFWNKILALLRSILGDFFMAKILPKSLGDFFLEKISPNAIKNRPNGKISPNLVTLVHIFSCVWPFKERAVSDLGRSMHRSLWV